MAGQTLTGLLELHHLLSDAAGLGLPVLAWPMDGLADDGASQVGLKVYPSFCRPRSVAKSDDADARACCEWAAQADLARASSTLILQPGSSVTYSLRVMRPFGERRASRGARRDHAS